MNVKNNGEIDSKIIISKYNEKFGHNFIVYKGLNNSYDTYNNEYRCKNCKIAAITLFLQYIEPVSGFSKFFHRTYSIVLSYWGKKLLLDSEIADMLSCDEVIIKQIIE